MTDRQAWLEARRKGLGGTDAAAILGLSKYRSARDVYLDKRGLEPDRPITAPMRWGLRLEDSIAAAYSEETGRPIRRLPGLGIRRAKHVRGFPMFGSLDRLSEDRIVEIKTARSDAEYAPRGAELDVEPIRRIPASHYVQVQHYAEIVGADVDVVVLFGGSDLRIYPIPRDPEYGADLVEELGRFWRDYVLAGVEPPVGPDDGPLLARRYPTSTIDEKVATSEMTLLLDRVIELGGISGIDGEIDALERERDELVNRVKDFLGPTGTLVAPGTKVSWRSYDRTTVSWKTYAGVLEAAFARARINPTAARALDQALSDGAGTTSLDEIRGLYSETNPVRPFRIDRKGKV